MSARSFSSTQPCQSKQAVSTPQLYQNVNSMMMLHNYKSVDELPLPPQPTSANNCSNQQLVHDSRFPPPPPSAILNERCYSSSINDYNQFRRERLFEDKFNNNLYANLLPHPVSTSSHVSLYDEPISNRESGVSFDANFRMTESPTYANLNYNDRKTYFPINRNNNSGQGVCDNIKQKIHHAKQQPSDSDCLQSQTTIYANLNNPNNNNSSNNNLKNLGARDYKLNSVPIKNSLRVNRSSATKEEDEVDHLTDLLVKSMENSAEPDFFGMCNKCGEKVVGEGSGCTAMEMVYHIQCFTCFECNKELRGKSFYAMESNPFCEECYLNTLEKCCICEKPILDRILRATGRPYHPNCFSCVVCKKCLDGIPFTVDAANQIHCIDDFHKKFAPRCSVCNDPIVPEPGKTETVRVVALDRSFHVSCYKCEDCDLLLSSETEGRGCYPLDDHILCRSCNAKRVQAISA